jgi:hypothetical protein
MPPSTTPTATEGTSVAANRTEDANGQSSNFRGLHAWLGTPVDAAGLVAFRSVFGALLLFSALRFAAYGWIDEILVAPSFHFTYLGFDCQVGWAPGCSMACWRPRPPVSCWAGAPV